MPALLLHYHHHAFILFRRDSLMKNLATFETFKRFWMYIYLGRYIYVLCTYVLKKPMPNYFKRPRKLQTFTYLTIQWLHQSHDRWVDPWPCGKNVKKINKNHNRLTAVFTLVNNMVKKRKNFFFFAFKKWSKFFLSFYHWTRSQNWEKIQNDKCMNGKNLKSIVFIFGLTDKTFQLIRSIFSFRIEMKTSFERTEKRSNPWKIFHISLDF